MEDKLQTITLAEKFSKILNLGVDTSVNEMMVVAVALAGVGMLSFAVLEAIKAVFPVRWWVNGIIFDKWLRRGVTTNLDAVEDELVKLATSGVRSILFSLPAERLTGQLNAAVQTSLAYPKLYGPLIQALAKNADPQDLKNLTGGVPSIAKPGEPTPQEKAALEDFTGARTRVTALIQRNLDVLQIRTEFWWATGNQVAAVVVSALYIYYFLNQAGYSLNAFLFSVIGGMVAPVAKDIVASLKGIKGRAN